MLLQRNDLVDRVCLSVRRSVRHYVRGYEPRFTIVWLSTPLFSKHFRYLRSTPSLAYLEMSSSDVANERSVDEINEETPTIVSNVVVPKFGFMQGNLPVVGGSPDAAFTRSLSVVAASPFCARNPNPHHAENSYRERVKGLDPKFNPSSTDYRLVQFADTLFNHCVDHGMDTPFYIPDPVDGTRLLNLFTHHGKFTYDDVKTHLQEKIAAGVFDQYMIISLSESATFLLNCLDRAFQHSIRTSLNPGDSRLGPIVWMKITEDVVPNMFGRLNELDTLFRGRSVKTTPGENVNVYAQEQLETLIEMETTDNLPRDHLLVIWRQLVSCSVEAFRAHWHWRYHQLSEFARLSAGKSPEVAKKIEGYATYRTLLQEAKTTYGNLKEDWGPATASSTAANAAALKSLKAEVKSLKSKFGDKADKTASTPSKDKKTSSSTPPKSSASSNGGKQDKKSDGSTAPRWNKVPPADGEPTTITKHGKKFHWCATCKRWTQTHGTADHRSRSDAAAATPPSTPAANFAQTRSAPLMSSWGSDSDSE